jgi:hypothetical protein
VSLVAFQDARKKMNTQESTVPRGLRRLKYMYGTVTQIELKNFLDVNSVDTLQRRQEIRVAWQAAVERFTELRRTEAGAPETIASRPIATEYDARAKTLREDAAFVNTFSNYPFSFEEVEIDKLVASQRSVHVEYVDYLATRYRQERQNLFEFCLSPAQGASPVSIGRTAANAFTISSDNPGLRFLGAFEEPYRQGLLNIETPGGQAIRAVVLTMGFGFATANVYRVGQRMILNNGFHRLFTLRSLGITHAPVVVQQITHPEVELPPAIAELPREYLVGNPRPALIKDFFDDQLTCIVTQRGFLKALQVGWAVNESMVPMS